MSQFKKADMVFEPRLDYIEHTEPQEQEVATQHKKITAKKTPPKQKISAQ